jgi:cold shock CspA family protein/ribosome-associated translation inhibitor RaiA
MQTPIQIHFRNMDPSPAAESHIRKWTDALERFYPHIVACNVTVISDARRHHQGKLYHLKILLTVPGGEIVVSRDSPQHHAHEDVLVAVHDAFNSAVRQLEDHARRLRADVKTHEIPNHGRIARLFPDYGFIQSSGGDEIYMHRNAVVGTDFDKLAAGDEVRYVLHEGEGEKGPQASTVILVGKHHLSPTAS